MTELGERRLTWLLGLDGILIHDTFTFLLLVQRSLTITAIVESSEEHAETIWIDKSELHSNIFLM
jgi:hypothetical protein